MKENSKIFKINWIKKFWIDFLCLFHLVTKGCDFFFIRVVELAHDLTFQFSRESVNVYVKFCPTVRDWGAVYPALLNLKPFWQWCPRLPVHDRGGIITALLNMVPSPLHLWQISSYLNCSSMVKKVLCNCNHYPLNKRNCSSNWRPSKWVLGV